MFRFFAALLPSRHDLGWLLLAFVLYAVLRFPMLVHASGQMDEQFFAVPGYTIYREGIPRIPFAGSRERSSLFQDSDVCLFSLPPGLYYLQAPFFALMAPGYPTARMPSFVAGFLVLILVWRLAKFAQFSSNIAGMATCMVAMCRPLMFTATIARPDLLCVACGLGVAHCFQYWTRNPTTRTLIVSGALTGLGGLFHPFAIVFGIQGFAWTFLKSGNVWTRIQRVVVLGGVALAVFSGWLPLILSYPKEFEAQFMPNVLEKSGPGLLQRLLWPWQSFARQAVNQWEFNEPFQAVFLMLGLVLGIFFWMRKPSLRERTQYLIFVLSSIYLIATATGLHPSKGYWAYPIILVYPLAVWGFASLYEALNPLFGKQAELARLLGIGLLFVVMLPGAGLRTTVLYLKNWGDEKFHGQRFIASVLSQLPHDGIFICDVSYVFDVYLSGRKTLLGQPKQQYWGEGEMPFDYLLVGNEGLQNSIPQQYGSVFWKRFGERTLPQNCFVEVYTGPEESRALSGEKP